MENLRSVKREISTSILGFAFFDTERFVSENLYLSVCNELNICLTR